MHLLADHPGLLAFLIFLMRLCDVSLGTVRTILVVRGYRAGAVFIAFFEVLLWVTAVGQVLHNLDEWYLAIAYAAGFAAGNWAGMWLEAKLALGQELVRAISRNPEVSLASRLREDDYDVTELAGRGSEGAVEVLLVVERRRRVPALLRLIRDHDPSALCTLSDVRHPPGAPRPRPRRRFPFGGLLGVTKRK